MNGTSYCKIHYELTRTPHVYRLTIPIACGFVAILIIVANISMHSFKIYSNHTVGHIEISCIVRLKLYLSFILKLKLFNGRW